MSDQSVNDLPSLAIRRPILIFVANLLIVIAGIAAIFGIEVRELPDVDRPVVSVNANYPGASPETMDAEVTSIVEGAVARVSGVLEIRSSSEENNSRIRIEFSPSTNLDIAASDVREAVNRVERELPDDVEQLTVVKADSDAEPVVSLAVYSGQLDEDELTRVVENDLSPEFLAIDGVAEVTLSGDRQRLLRVVLDPLRLTSYGLTVSDVAEELRNAQFDVPAGSFRSVDQELLVRADATVVNAQQVEDIVIRDPVRIGDVAQVYFGPEDAMSYVRLNGRPVIGMSIIRQAQSNTINISDGVREVQDRLNQRFDNLEIVTTSDDAVFIKGSVQEVLTTLLFTVAIVFLTIWLFIGSLRTTLIPALAIPVALIGSVAAIWLLGFSINMLTLLALVLATGMIVDDAIVVLENIQRQRGRGMRARASAVLGTRQVFFAVVATTAVLISVFVPISFMPSTAGRLFREFGFVLAIAVAISSFVALTLVPALAARLARPAKEENPLRNRINTLGSRLAQEYESALGVALRHAWISVGVAVLAAAGAGLLYTSLDKELVPSEDRGTIYVWASGPDGVGLTYSERQADRIEAILRPYVDSGEIESIYTIVGRYDLNRVWITAPLAPWENRERSQQEILEELTPKLAQIPGMRVNAFGRSSLSFGGGRSGIEVALTGSEYDDIYEAAKAFSEGIETQLPNVTDPEISYQPTQPQLSVRIDRRRAADLGVPLDDLATTLRAMIDGYELVDLNIEDQAIPIYLEGNTGAIDDPSDLVNLYVRSNSGALIPISSLASLVEEGVAAELDRVAQRRAIEVESSIAPGYPLQSAVDDLRTLAESLPEGISMITQGEAATLQETSREVAITYAIALLIVFLVLAAQFESLTSAIVVMLTVPFGIAAAIFALFLTGVSINIYSQIGLVMLIGLMAKNGILVVEFADQLRDQGMEVFDAITKSASIRLRPIMMTLMSTVLGGLPLILSGGPGAESRASIGWVVFGGLGLAAAFTLFLTPVIYLGIARFSQARAHETARLEEELEAARKIPDESRESLA